MKFSLQQILVEVWHWMRRCDPKHPELDEMDEPALQK